MRRRGELATYAVLDGNGNPAAVVTRTVDGPVVVDVPDAGIVAATLSRADAVALSSALASALPFATLRPVTVTMDRGTVLRRVGGVRRG